jgi:nicotinamidase/pyrazinamidase
MKFIIEETAEIAVDPQNDFADWNGTLYVTGGARAVRVVASLLKHAKRKGLRAYASRDWHDRKAAHFAANGKGGIWPFHCIAGTRGAEFHWYVDELIAASATIVTKGTSLTEDDYSSFDGTTDEGLNLNEDLQRHGIKVLIVSGLATDFCVLATVLRGIELGYTVYLVTDAIRAVNLEPDAGQQAIAEMVAAGATLCTSQDIRQAEYVHHWEEYAA